MGGGGQPVTQSNEPPAWLKPHLESFVNRATATADLPYQPYTGQRNADINPLQAQAFGSVYGRAMQGSPVASAAQQEAQKSISGGYLTPESNPYLSGMVNRAMGDVTKAYSEATAPMTDAAFARKGAFGGSAWEQATANNQAAMTKQLAGIANDMYGGNYENERRRQIQYASMAPQLAQQDYMDAQALMGAGNQLAQYQQGLLDTDYGNFLEARGYPQQQLDILRNALGMNFGQQSTSTQPGRSPVSGAVGGALAGSQIAPMLGFGGPAGAIGGALLGLLG